MSSSAQPPSIFVSYASGDRAAVRVLRTTLAAAGLDVWFDEEELAGGDAWDAKIRTQIRTCTYFMPVISATTESRREGYFRREWRLAVERTLDIADDVTFLVPVVIDDTSEKVARVPERFTSVQWLRCPGGRETPALVNLAYRLMAEAGHGAPVRPVAATPPLVKSDPLTESTRDEPEVRPANGAKTTEFPSFPPFPETGRRSRFVYDLVVWAGRAWLSLWRRLPRAIRLFLTVCIILKVASFLFDRSSSKEEATEAKAKTQLNIAVPTAEEIESDTGFEHKALRAAGLALDALQAGRPLAMVPFASSDRSVKEAADNVFSALRLSLRTAGKKNQVAVSPAPFAIETSDAEVFARGAALQCRWILVGNVEPVEGDFFVLRIKLYEVATQNVIWEIKRTAAKTAADATGSALGAELLKQISFDPVKEE